MEINVSDWNSKDWEEYLKFIEEYSQKFIEKKKTDDQNKIKVGDKVKVIDPEVGYTTYAEWVYKNIQGENKCRYSYKTSCSLNTIGEVLFIGKHFCDDYDLAYIKSEENECYLIRLDGLQKLKEG